VSVRPSPSGRCRDEEGQALVLVLIVAALLVVLLTSATAATINALGMSSQYSRSSQAALASQSGIAEQLAAMRSVSVYTSLPCSLSGSLTVSGAASAYSVSVAYQASGSALTCAGSTLGGTTAPTSATLTSTGTATHGATTVTKADVAIATSTSYPPAFSYAIFTENDLSFEGAATLGSSGANIPNVWAGQTVSCPNGTTTQGSVTTDQAISLTGACSIGGDLVSTGQISMANSAAVGGSLFSYGGGIVMSGNSTVAKNATETNGSISLSGSPTITGTASATGTITAPAGSIGTENQGDSALVSQSAPAPVNWPLVNPTVASWQGAGWNVIQIPNGAYTCSTYFGNYSSGSADPFMTAISTAVQMTVVYAPTCAVSYSRSHVFQLSEDTVLEAQSVTLAGSNTFESTNATVHNLSILASAGATCSTSTVDVNFSNSTSFLPTTAGANPAGLDVFLYTPGEADYANAPSMTGQILACGGMTGTNSFALYFSPTAADEIPGTGSPLAPTITVEDKFVV
jgi:hypothetical protein